MTWTNYHTHSSLCDGEGEPAAYLEQAVKQGLRYFGFSSHAPLPFENDWTLPADKLHDYRQTMISLKQQYADRMPLFWGLEIDYIPGETSPTARVFADLDLDYTLGAIHFAGRDGAGEHWSIDHTPEEFAFGLETGFQNDIRQAVALYYALVREMIQEACPDVVAHLDLIKKNNTNECYFSEKEPWYQQAVCQTLETLAASPAILEVNTGGVARKRTDAFYPSTWILEHCYQMGIPVTLSSDAHRPDQISAEFTAAARVLREVGYEYLHIFDESGWHPCPFSVSGLADI